jgi:hypothetical protein
MAQTCQDLGKEREKWGLRLKEEHCDKDFQAEE